MCLVPLRFQNVQKAGVEAGQTRWVRFVYSDQRS